MTASSIQAGTADSEYELSYTRPLLNNSVVMPWLQLSLSASGTAVWGHSTAPLGTGN